MQGILNITSEKKAKEIRHKLTPLSSHVKYEETYCVLMIRR